MSPRPDRCGYRLDVGLIDADVPSEPCDRPVWEDHDCCVWHAPVDGKTTDLLEDARPAPGEVVDGAYLRRASLAGVDWLADTSMIGADLTDADLTAADLSGADLTLATLTDASGMNADFSGANLEGAIFTNADLRRATLEDARFNEAVLTDVHVGENTTFGERSIYDRESVRPTLGDVHPLEAASWTYREFQMLYRANGFPQRARRSYSREKDARRRLAWKQDDYGTAIKWELSRWVMCYGNSPYRVLLASLVVIVVAAILFPFTGGIQEIHADGAITYRLDDPAAASGLWVGRVLFKSLYFSVVTFATLGYGDIQPIGAWARILASVLTVLGSLLSALLVFVLARTVTW